MNKIIGFKGFSPGLKCRDFQFAVGETYKHEGEIALCESGFHFCKNPLDVFSYYSPGTSEYCQVEAGKTIDQEDKSCTDEITVIRKLSLSELIAEAVKLAVDKKIETGDYSAATNTGNWSAATNTGCQSAATNTGCQSAATNTGYRSAATNTGYRSAATNTGNWSAATNTGDRSAATNTGYGSAATNTGDWSAATNTGDRSAASVEGKDSVAIVTGYGSKAKGALGCWLVLTERDENYNILNLERAKIDGLIIKANQFYKLVNEKFVEVD